MKQQEIREGIFDIIRPYFKMHNDAVSISYKIRNYLHSQGVVIKVERELPKIKELKAKIKQWEGKDRGEPAVYEMYQTELWTTEGTQQDMLEAGYVAVEPIGAKE